MWSLSQQGLQTWAQGRERDAEQAKPLPPSHRDTAPAVITSQRRATGIHIGGSSLPGTRYGAGGGQHPAWKLATQMRLPQTSSKEASRPLHRAGNIDCQERAGRRETHRVQAALPQPPTRSLRVSKACHRNRARLQSNSRPD